MTTRHDVAVIGAGPVGLFTACYAGMRGLSVVIIDSLSEPGGQVAALYPEKFIRDVAGFAAVRGREFVDSLLEQVAPFDPAWILGRAALSLEGDQDRGFRLGLADGGVVAARSVIVTAGVGTFAPRPLAAAVGFRGEGVSYFVRQPAALAQRRVVIVGGGDSAFDWADTLHELGAEVVLVHRRSTFRAHPSTVERVRTHGIRIVTGAEVAAVHGAARVEGVTIKNAESGASEMLACDHVVAALGFVADPGPIATWGMELVQRKIVVDRHQETTRPGIFSAGDICTYPGRLPLITVGFGEAATAANYAAVNIDPDQSAFPGHSTDEPVAVPVG